MRVLFINSRLDAEQNPGGDTIQAQKTRAALEELGVEVMTRGPYELDNLPACDLVHIFNMQEPEPAWAAMQVLQRQGMPVLLSSIYWDMLAHWFEMAVEGNGRWSQIAHLVGKNNTRPVYIGWQRLKSPTNARWRTQRRLLAQARRVLPNSQSEADLLQHTFAFGRSFQAKVDDIPNAIDTSLYEPLPAPSQNFWQKYGLRDFVLQVGTVYPAKNQLAVIEALYDLPVPLVFIGKVLEPYAEYAAQCQARAAARGNVLFLDHIPHDELPGIYALAAVHVLPSWRETPGLVSLEAAAAGCRIVTTSIGSTHDYFGEDAWYCYPNDLPSIRQAVEKALAAPSSTRLRQRILAQYNWRATAVATLASYQKALQTTGLPATAVTALNEAHTPV
jgi:glycosyltransferase involved in cell wall biosynthesis